MRSIELTALFDDLERPMITPKPHYFSERKLTFTFAVRSPMVSEQLFASNCSPDNCLRIILFARQLIATTIIRTDNYVLGRSCVSVCNVHALWPNGWTDQDETWRAGRPRPWPHCVRRRPSSPSKKGAHHQFSAHGQTARWIKMPLGTEVGFRPGYIMLDADPAPPT